MTALEDELAVSLTLLTCAVKASNLTMARGYIDKCEKALDNYDKKREKSGE